VQAADSSYIQVQSLCVGTGIYRKKTTQVVLLCSLSPSPALLQPPSKETTSTSHFPVTVLGRLHAVRRNSSGDGWSICLTTTSAHPPSPISVEEISHLLLHRLCRNPGADDLPQSVVAQDPQAVHGTRIQICAVSRVISVDSVSRLHPPSPHLQFVCFHCYH
jgi:hypothetical protein